MTDAHEPWYQTVSMGRDEAKEHLFTTLKFEYDDHDLLRTYIDQTVPRDTDLGSIRGYWTFLHSGYKQQVVEKLRHFGRKKLSQGESPVTRKPASKK